MDLPVLVYDDDCGFCTWWADFVDERSDIPLIGFSELGEHQALLRRLPEGYADCSHLVTEERIYSCGESIEEALARTEYGSRARPIVDRLRTFGPYNAAREWGYRGVADHRSFWGKLVSKTPPARESEDAKRAE